MRDERGKGLRVHAPLAVDGDFTHIPAGRCELTGGFAHAGVLGGAVGKDARRHCGRGAFDE